MQVTATSLATILVAILAQGCKTVECGDGTTERDGQCVAASQATATARCGPFTELHGDQCVPTFPPTVCDPATTEPDTDEAGVTTCLAAAGASGCSTKLACPTPAQGGLQTVCGQIYDFETGEAFAASGAIGTPCAAGATSGPCTLALKAYDAVAFASTPPGTPPPAVAAGAVYIDDCGRYSIPNIPLSQVTSQILLVTVDDAGTDKLGPAGTTNAVGLTTAAVAGSRRDFDVFVVPAATSMKWASNGGPAVSAGILAAVFHGHSTGSDLASGVSFQSFRGSAQVSASYLSGPTRSTVDPALTATGANGTALVTLTNSMLTTDLYFGQGGLDAACMWGPQPALTIPYAILVESFRPVSVTGMTCPL